MTCAAQDAAKRVVVAVVVVVVVVVVGSRSRSPLLAVENDGTAVSS